MYNSAAVPTTSTSVTMPLRRNLLFKWEKPPDRGAVRADRTRNASIGPQRVSPSIRARSPGGWAKQHTQWAARAGQVRGGGHSKRPRPKYRPPPDRPGARSRVGNRAVNDPGGRAAGVVEVQGLVAGT